MLEINAIDRRFGWACWLSLWLVAAANAGETSTSSTEFRVFPERIDLFGPDSSAGVLVQRQQAEQTTTQIREGVRLQSRDPAVAQVSGGRLHATATGSTHLDVYVHDEAVASVPVEVIADQDRASGRWQFEAHVQSIFARQGCNSGACHGALAGKGGFRLSLHGYDPESDHYNITRQDRGRRIEPADPGRSLLLAKPTMLLPHKGGLRLEEGSADYRLLAEWIASGAPPRLDTDAALTRVEVLPVEVRLAVSDRQQLIVRGHYADGRVEDVTRWAKFTSANEAVAEVDEHGEVRVVGHGKGAISVWFGSQIVMSSVVVPFQDRLNANHYSDFHPANLIDEILLEEWQSLGLAPSPGCADDTFLRRAFMDATGTIPSPERLRTFLGDNSALRRARVVDELLSSEAFVDYWAYQWSDLLLVNGNLLRPDAIAAFYTWIRKQVLDNTPWDEFARQIVLAKGESTSQGATNFYAIHQDPEALTENTCQAFLGLSIGCAKCHNHPLEKWTNDQYYAMANLYARVRAKGWGGDARSGDGKRTLLVLDRGDLIQPSRGKPQPPAPLDAHAMDMHDTRDRRVVLAEWLTHPQNRYFSRAIANRVWANFMGVGLVESVDDLRTSNPASSERLLNALADYLIEQNYDLKSLMRLIMNSQVYQRSAQAIPANESDNRFYCRYYPRRLMAEALHDAVVSVTGVPTAFTEIEFAGADKRPTEFYPEGTSALELYDSAVVNYFLKTFGRHQRRITCDCERSDQPTVVQVLHLNNGDTLNNKLDSDQCIVSTWVADQTPASEVVDQAYLRALTRFPSADERSRMLELIFAADAEQVSRAETYRDLLWSLMTSPEFLFAH